MAQKRLIPLVEDTYDFWQLDG